jgi:hypothetical protein
MLNYDLDFKVGLLQGLFFLTFWQFFTKQQKADGED